LAFNWQQSALSSACSSWETIYRGGLGSEGSLRFLHTPNDDYLTMQREKSFTKLKASEYLMIKWLDQIKRLQNWKVNIMMINKSLS